MTFEWLKRGATVDDLQKQLEAARDAHQESLDSVARAQAAFDDDPRKHKGLLDAQDSERGARAYLDRAERLLTEAKTKVQAEERAKLEHRANELREQLSPSGLRKLRAPLLNAEVEALKQAIDVHAKAQEVEEHIGQLDHELKQLRVQLGEPAEEVFTVSSFQHGPTRPSADNIAAGLADAFKDLGVDDKRRRYARAMTSYLRDA